MAKTVQKNIQATNDAAQQETGRKDEFFADIPDFATADDALKARMEERIKTLDPSDINTIIMYGSKPLEKLARISDRLIEVQERSNLFAREFADAAEGLGALNPSALFERTSRFAGKGLNAVRKNKKEAMGALAGLLTFGPLGALVGAAGGHVLKRGTEKKDPLQKVVDELGESLLKSREIENNLRDAKARIPAVIADVQKLGRARLEAFSDLALDIGAGKEYLRRLDEDIIPQAVNDSDGRLSFDSADRIETLTNARNQLDATLTELTSNRAVSFNAAATMKVMNQFLPALMGKINHHLNSSLPQWKAQIAQGGIALDAYRMAQSSKESDKFGDKLLENNAALLEGVNDMVRETLSRGTFDAEKIIDATNRLSQRFREDADLMLGHVEKNSEDVRRRLIDATDRLKVGMAEAQLKTNERLLAAPNAGPRAITGPK